MVPQEKIALFIDGANLYATAKSLGFDIDYKRLLREFQSRGYLLRAFYYTAVIEDQEYSSIRPLIDWLDYNGYAVVTKATKEFVDQTGRRKVKGNMDIELAVDAMEIAGTIDHMVLFSGDGDFRSLVEAVQRRGVRVTVVSTISTQPPMVADELRRQADIFLDIVELQSKIGRDPAERVAREPREPRGERHTPQFLQRPRGAAARRAPARPMTTISTTEPISTASRSTTKRSHQARNECPARPANRGVTVRSAPASRRFARIGASASRAGSTRRSHHSDPTQARLLIVGLAPGLRGANRTGRPFTGDYAGDLLYDTLTRYGFARGTYQARPDDGLELVDTRITNAVRCVPPENKPTTVEIKTCRGVSRRDHRRNAEACRHRHARPHLARQHARGAGTAPLRRAIRPRRRFDIGKRQAVRELSLLALQHQYRRADAGDVPHGVCRRARPSRCKRDDRALSW